MEDASVRPRASSPVAEPVGLAVTGIGLTNFRSYLGAQLEVAPAPVVLAGPNGTGKTNLLEALSLLSPGRGLRGAKLTELQRNSPLSAEPVDGAFADSLWAVSATVARGEGAWEIGTGLATRHQPEVRPARVLHLNGVPAASADIAELVPMLWLTPALDRLFSEGAGERRRFLDRLAFALDANHARRAARYERAMHERLRLLRDGVRDPVWLDGVEETMAIEGSELTRARLLTIERLNTELSARGAEGTFPCAHVALHDALVQSAEDPGALRGALSLSRARDADTARTTVGPHLADMHVRHTLKRAAARDCSTGEQKALLISIVLANAWLQKKRQDGVAPLLLLDEVAAHLDAQRRSALFKEILALKAQAWLTGTDKGLFAGLLPHAQCFVIVAGQFARQD
jgi:DNA replication and repair protein RecF